MIHTTSHAGLPLSVPDMTMPYKDKFIHYLDKADVGVSVKSPTQNDIMNMSVTYQQNAIKCQTLQQKMHSSQVLFSSQAKDFKKC